MKRKKLKAPKRNCLKCGEDCSFAGVVDTLRRCSFFSKIKEVTK